jgi:hypothetical protein
MALVHSQSKDSCENPKPKSRNVAIIQSSGEQQLVTTTYSASVVEWETLNYLREDQETREDPKTDMSQKWTCNLSDNSQNQHQNNFAKTG